MVSDGNDLNVTLNPNWFQFHHYWELKEIHLEYQMDLFELDDLPDPIDNLLNVTLTKPNPIMFFPAVLHPSNLVMRKGEINRALNRFVIRLEVHIEAKT